MTFYLRSSFASRTSLDPTGHAKVQVATETSVAIRRLACSLNVSADGANAPHFSLRLLTSTFRDLWPNHCCRATHPRSRAMHSRRASLEGLATVLLRAPAQKCAASGTRSLVVWNETIKLLARIGCRQNPLGMLSIGFKLGRIRLHRLVGALCLLSVAFVGIFHALQPAASPTGVLAVYGTSDDTSPALDKGTFDNCHLCGAITSLDARPRPLDGEKERPSPEGRLAAFTPKVTGPPPKSDWG